MNPPPPMLPAEGCVTASANPVAMAASTALPPARSTARPTWLARRSTDTTIPFGDRAGGRDTTGSNAMVAGVGPVPPHPATEIARTMR